MRTMCILSLLVQGARKGGARAVRPWLDSWAGNQGGLPGSLGVSSHLWDTAAEVEHALSHHGSAAGISSGLRKAFGHISFRHVEDLGRQHKVPRAICGTLLWLNGHPHRLSQFPATRIIATMAAPQRGVPQGCALGPLTMCLVISGWRRSLEESHLHWRLSQRSG